MCGINGFTWKNEALCKVMNDTIIHRGPDNQGVYIDEHITIGGVRLSITDVNDRSNQPFVYKNVVLSFNGEIYNYKKLKSELLN